MGEKHLGGGMTVNHVLLTFVVLSHHKCIKRTGNITTSILELLVHCLIVFIFNFPTPAVKGYFKKPVKVAPCN